MGLPKRLTEMQKRFAEYIVFNEGRTTGADAAIAAGYSEKRARVEASELQNPRLSPLVVPVSYTHLTLPTKRIV